MFEPSLTPSVWFAVADGERKARRLAIAAGSSGGRRRPAKQIVFPAQPRGEPSSGWLIAGTGEVVLAAAATAGRVAAAVARLP